MNLNFLLTIAIRNKREKFASRFDNIMIVIKNEKYKIIYIYICIMVLCVCYALIVLRQVKLSLEYL